MATHQVIQGEQKRRCAVGAVKQPALFDIESQSEATRGLDRCGERLAHSARGGSTHCSSDQVRCQQAAAQQLYWAHMPSDHDHRDVRPSPELGLALVERAGTESVPHYRDAVRTWATCDETAASAARRGRR
jgi:hypothetical protein